MAPGLIIRRGGEAQELPETAILYQDFWERDDQLTLQFNQLIRPHDSRVYEIIKLIKSGLHYYEITIHD